MIRVLTALAATAAISTDGDPRHGKRDERHDRGCTDVQSRVRDRRREHQPVAADREERPVPARHDQARTRLADRLLGHLALLDVELHRDDERTVHCGATSWTGPATCNQDVPNIFGQLSDRTLAGPLERVDASPCLLVNSGEETFGNAYRVKHNPAASTRTSWARFLGHPGRRVLPPARRSMGHRPERQERVRHGLSVGDVAGVQLRRAQRCVRTATTTASRKATGWPVRRLPSQGSSGDRGFARFRGPTAS